MPKLEQLQPGKNRLSKDRLAALGMMVLAGIAAKPFLHNLTSHPSQPQETTITVPNANGIQGSETIVKYPGNSHNP